MPDKDEEFEPWCDDMNKNHVWSEWKIGPFFAREERFCSLCGGMETQEICPGCPKCQPEQYDGLDDPGKMGS